MMIFITKIFLYINTIKYLKWSQIFYRLCRGLWRKKKLENYSINATIKSDKFITITLYDQKITKSMVATFIGKTKKLNLPGDWNHRSLDKLWLYNLHYFDDLMASSANEKHEFHVQLLDDWEQGNPIFEGNGWEAYPISLRVVNMLKAWHAGLELKDRHFKSIYRQVSVLVNNLEKHLLGNHYFVNLKALFFAGIIFENDKWLKLALDGFYEQIPEQILDDGAHFELSPMYHSLILVDMLDMYNLSNAYPTSNIKNFKALLEWYIPKMLNFMILMAHNDGGMSFFNDSVNDIAPSQQRIIDYAKMLGFKVEQNCKLKPQLFDLIHSGYMVAICNRNKLIFDAANIGPDYIPGHAHADTLSFEFSILQDRVFVNSGTSEYGNTNTRLSQRQTRSHNTVEVDKKSSSQVWSSFRVARRALIKDRTFSISEDELIIRASHDGYKRIFAGPIHRREIRLSAAQLIVCDHLDGSFESATARFFLHPNLKVELDGNDVVIIGENFKMCARARSGSPRIKKTTWHPSFGASFDNLCIEYDFIEKNNTFYFTWAQK
ncbi:heparinase II/III family protein [Planktomarina sp.]|nr:alginate lyase family protein [Planktomarina sp.]MDB4841060.1 heparinase II/III family protein [Planktomarina sp.]